MSVSCAAMLGSIRGTISGIDGRNPRLDVEVGRTHDALRLDRRATNMRKWQSRNGQGQRRASRLHPPIGTIVDHETSGLSAIRQTRATRPTAQPPQD